jgi:hypothetical protein
MNWWIVTSLLALAGKYSITILLLADAGNSRRFKLLFEDDMSAEDFNLAVSKFLDFLADYYGNRLDQGTQARLSSARVVGGTILAAYDRASGEFTFVDPIPAARNE